MPINDNNHQFTAITLAITFATLSLLASLLTLLLIRRLQKWNGYIQLVVSLTVCQIIYDISFFFLPIISLWGQYLYVFFNTLGGLTSSLWSNVIILVTARIVIRLRTVDTLKKVRRVCMCVCVYVCMCVCVDVWMYVCVDVWMCGCVDVWMYVCVDVCMCVCVDVWMCGRVDVWMCVCVDVCTRMCV